MVKVCKFGAQMVQFGNFCALKIIIVVNLFYLIKCAGTFNRKIVDYGDCKNLIVVKL
ncbi:CDP-diacylglycerol--glycerol-3-phosphate 3-phosphatidyltransferase [Limosilactobacillus reuteri]|nr:CDP-diacylglycerol--glycerol-3-phosphate 3-phosphatidyltransferase [Limosilactobacillus reuteri]